MPIVVTVESAEEPITVADAKEHLNVWSDADDTYIASLIRVARQAVEVLTQRALVTKTLKYYLDSFCRSVMTLPMPNIQSVASVNYYDVAGVLQTLSSASYFVDSVSTPGRICLRDGYSWPDVEAGRPNAVVVEFTAGFGGAADVPDDLKHAVKMLVGHWYANREDVVLSSQAPLPMIKAAEYLAMPYRVYQ